MSVRNLTTRSLLLAAAAAVAIPLAAQDTTRLRRPSEARISVSKGEVALPPRVDTVFVTRYDTVRVNNTIVRIDTVTVTPPPVYKELNDWFWALYAGATAPISAIDRIYTNGYHFGGAIGWDPRDSWFGARLSVGGNQVGREQGLPVFLVGEDVPFMWQFAGDLKTKWPLGGWAPYLVGGLGFNTFRRMATVSDVDFDRILLAFDPIVTPLQRGSILELDDDGDLTACRLRDDFDLDLDDNLNGLNRASFNCFRLPRSGTNSSFSWNFGVGTDFRIGSQEMFFEWRWNPSRTNGAWTWYMPISLGVRYF